MSAGGAFGDALDEVKCVQRQACGSEACPGHCVRARPICGSAGIIPNALAIWERTGLSGNLGPDDQKNGTDGDPTTWLPFAAVIF
jgi:hypothetical protein